MSGKRTSGPLLRKTLSGAIRAIPPRPGPPKSSSAQPKASSATQQKTPSAQTRPSQSTKLNLTPLPPTSSTNEENVQVVLRVRPLSTKEKAKKCQSIVTISENSIVVKNTSTNPKQDNAQKGYTFDSVFGTESTQEQVFKRVAIPIIENVVRGYNGTILAYGQTGTGKTFTMEGKRDVPELRGIIPNSFEQIFTHIEKESENSKFLVRASYLEIYNEEIRDLLVQEAALRLKKLDLKEHPDSGIYVKGLSNMVVKNEADMEKILRLGNKNRVTGSTKMNSESSRSHAIFTITIECSSNCKENRLLRAGKLNLVDLAGSERVSKTGATGQSMKEGAKINLSLSSLGNVISALVDNDPYVPYRNSKLTRLLQDSLGGNSKTVMIANIGPADYNYEETMSTLRYAHRAKSIKNHAVLNEDPKNALLRQYEKEIEELRKELARQDKLAAEREAKKGSGEPIEIPYDEAIISTIRSKLKLQHELKAEELREREEKDRVLKSLQENIAEFERTEEKKRALMAKLKEIEQNIMVGGVNLLEKSRRQKNFLRRADEEVEKSKRIQVELERRLEAKKAEERIYLRTVNASLKELEKKELELFKRKCHLEELSDEDDRRNSRNETEKDIVAFEIKEICGVYRIVVLFIRKILPLHALRIIRSKARYSTRAGRWVLPGSALIGEKNDPTIKSYLGNKNRLFILKHIEPVRCLMILCPSIEYLGRRGFYKRLIFYGNPNYYEDEFFEYEAESPLYVFGKCVRLAVLSLLPPPIEGDFLHVTIYDRFCQCYLTTDLKRRRHFYFLH